MSLEQVFLSTEMFFPGTKKFFRNRVSFWDHARGTPGVPQKFLDGGGGFARDPLPSLLHIICFSAMVREPLQAPHKIQLREVGGMGISLIFVLRPVSNLALVNIQTI